MNSQKIVGMTRDIGKPAEWNETIQGPCDSLPVRDDIIGNTYFMVSEWKPTKEELRKLLAGGSIFLGISGRTHPVVFLMVEV